MTMHLRLVRVHTQPFQGLSSYRDKVMDAFFLQVVTTAFDACSCHTVWVQWGHEEAPQCCHSSDWPPQGGLPR